MVGFVLAISVVNLAPGAAIAHYVLPPRRMRVRSRRRPSNQLQQSTPPLRQPPHRRRPSL